MATALKEPIYADRLAAWYGQTITRVLFAVVALCVVLAGIDLKHEFQPAPPPYVLKVNSNGEPVGQVLPILSVQAISNAILKAQLGDFIHDCFSVDRDYDEENRLWTRTQSRVTGQAAQALETWYGRDANKHHPQLTWRTTWAEAMPQDVLKLDGPDRYQVDFKVRTHTDNDQTITIANWRATLHVIVAHSSDPESLGWFIDWIDFQEVK